MGIEDDPYADAVIYDLEYSGMIEDLAYYLDKARRATGPVLELGCGTGRLTRQLARRGVTVHGLDRAPDMLRRLHALLAAEPEEVRARVTTEEADYRTWSTTTRFGAVLWPFNALHHCAGEEDLRGVLTAARGWIADDGFLALDCYLPDRTLYSRDPDAKYEFRTFTHPTTGEELESWEQGWWDEAAMVHHVIYTYRHPSGREQRSHLHLRMFERDRLLDAVTRSGWRVAREMSDFTGRPMDAAALKWVAVLAPA